MRTSIRSSAGLERLQCDLRAAAGPEAYPAFIAAYAAANPDLTWIQGGGWSMTDFPGGIADRTVLDRVVPDRPVYLENRDGHAAWVNSKALELAGIDASTADPADGRIERDADGQPNGTLQEGARHLVTRRLPAATPDESRRRPPTRPAASCTSSAITHWQDAFVDPTRRSPTRRWPDAAS